MQGSCHGATSSGQLASDTAFPFGEDAAVRSVLGEAKTIRRSAGTRAGSHAEHRGACSRHAISIKNGWVQIRQSMEYRRAYFKHATTLPVPPRSLVARSLTRVQEHNTPLGLLSLASSGRPRAH